MTPASIWILMLNISEWKYLTAESYQAATLNNFFLLLSFSVHVFKRFPEFNLVYAQTEACERTAVWKGL